MAITGSSGTRAISKKYPVVSGLTIETTKIEGRQTNLVPELGSLVARRTKTGIEK